MRISLVQINCRFGEKSRNLKHALHMIKIEQADLFVLPELFNSGYFFKDRAQAKTAAEPIPDGETCRELMATATKKNCYIVAGLPEQDVDRIFNSSVLIGPQGFIAVYRKIHLFDEEKIWFDPGDQPFRVHDIGMAKLGLMICFDWIFPESMRSMALQGADVICHSANLVMPYCQKAMTTRCLENGVFAVTANRVGVDKQGERQLHFTGQSQITGPRGEVLAQAGKFGEETQIATIDVEQARQKMLNQRNHLLNDRRPEMYTLTKKSG